MLKDRLNGIFNIVYSHVRPIPEKEYIAFTKYIHGMENNHYFQFFMLNFREKMLSSLDQNVDIKSFLLFNNLLNSEINKISKAYSEYLEEESKK